MNINLLKLQIVELLEKHRKITTVADLLGLKQPTVTFHMKNLERDFGVKLFDARMGRIILTDAGYALLHYASKINALAQEAQRVVGEFDSLRQGTLSIGASYVPATYILPAVIHDFTRIYPGIRISLSVKTAPVITQMLHAHQIDIGIISTGSFHTPPLVSQTICRDELVLICSPAHPFADAQTWTPEWIAASSFVLHGKESSTRRITDQWLDKQGIHLSSRLELDSLEAIKQAVMLGDHVSFISRMAVQAEVSRGLLCMRPIPDQPAERHVYAITNQDRYLSATSSRFIEHLESWRQSSLESILVDQD
ncbi:LysR family transcriptional regulator [Paenibacillus sp. JX-17]|uniref:LysR family transcriptional regulator n=1 Tax=Paenibacillus lacisoli TaxID=3064525 RepID=A0ABT9CE20_9BACL|nr:LysR family transcriptional regulator [Paenibacillus sp. JX-17]MDO7907515.1 LysR family transcriptional regulator [Paenibacillus sp. JX-17]